MGYGFLNRMSLSTLLLELIVAPVPLIIGMSGAAFLSILITLTLPITLSMGGWRQVQKFAMILANGYWYYLVSAIEKWGKFEFEFAGDKIPLRENAIVMANHRWYLDWLIIFSLAIRKGRLGCCKFFVKDSVKYVPGVGWGIAILGYVFLKRNWMNDLKTIDATFATLRDRKLPFWLVSHIEGTRFDPKKLKQSQEFAKKKDLPVLEHLLLPRTKGFVATIKSLRESKIADAVYDITIVYNKGKSYPTLADVVLRRGGSVDMYVRRFQLNDIPKEEEAMSQWIVDRWAEKDKFIDHLMKHGHYPNVYSDPWQVPPMELH